MVLISVLIGLILLLMGRRMFWVFVGAIGFFAGLDVARYLFAGQGEMALLIAGVTAGLIGIVLALAFQRLAIIAAGILGGGFFLAHILLAFMPRATEAALIITFIIGAVIGGVLVNVAFDAALIILSSFIGAMIVTAYLPVGQGIRSIVFVAAAVVGLIVQTQQASEALAAKKNG